MESTATISASEEGGKGVGAIELTIEPGAVVAVSARISYSVCTGATDELVAPQSQRPVRLVVGAGTVFHPSSGLTVIPPLAESGEEGSLVLRVSDNNLFEEGSNVTLDLRMLNAKEVRRVKDTVEIIGRYNHFSALCSVTAGSVGSANIFGPLCRLYAASVGNGNAIGPTVFLDTTSQSNPSQQALDVSVLGCSSVYAIDDGSGSGYSDTSNSSSKKISSSGGCRFVQTRPYTNGIERNMNEIGAALRASRGAVKEHHRLASDGTKVTTALE